MVWVQIGLYMVVLLLLVKPLGGFMAKVYQGEKTFLHPLIRPIERILYRITKVREEDEMDWRAYAIAVVMFCFVGFAGLYGLQRIQGIDLLNPRGFEAVPSYTAFNITTSFVTNTNWQNYGGETTLSYLTQMLGLTVQNFISAATGMAVLAALCRGLSRRSAQTIGNFWVDMSRSILYILLPLSLLVALILVSQGVVQTLDDYKVVKLVQPYTDANGNQVTEQILAVGPVASQVAIKQLGTNGGGFFNVNSAHPFENATPLSNFVQLLAILIIPASLCYTFGKMVGDTRQGWAVLVAMTLIFIPLVVTTTLFEQGGNSLFDDLNIDQSVGNMEGKEVRNSIGESALWAVATTAASNGSVNSMHDSYTPIGGLVPMWLMQLGEVIYGGVGSGLYGMLMFVILGVFVAGLMVGRTPEYLGKKIEVFEMKMASLVILIPPLLVLMGTALSIATDEGLASLQDSGPHGLSETLYAYSSAANNNGSAFAGFTANTTFQNIMLGLAMFFARYWLMIPVLAIAGSLAAKKKVPESVGTLPTHTPLFVVWLIVVVMVIGALAFLPALALGPIVEQLLLGDGITF